MLLQRDAQGQPIAIRREDYAAPAFWIDTVDLTFDLDPAKTRVLNRMQLRRNPDVPAQPLRLDGDELNPARVLVNGQGASFRMEGEQLVIDGLPDAFELEIFNATAPLLVGVVAAVLASMVLSLLHAWLCITIRADQIVVPVGAGVRLRWVNCPFNPFVDTNDQNVCQGI